MITVIKLASVSALLSAGFVSVVETPATLGAKPFQDRLIAEAPLRTTLADAGSAGATAISGACGTQAWPYISQDCVSGDDQPRRVVRTITIERRDAPNTSTLVRVSAPGR